MQNRHALSEVCMYVYIAVCIYFYVYVYNIFSLSLSLSLFLSHTHARISGKLVRKRVCTCICICKFVQIPALLNTELRKGIVRSSSPHRLCLPYQVSLNPTPSTHCITSGTFLSRGMLESLSLCCLGPSQTYPGDGLADNFQRLGR